MSDYEPFEAAQGDPWSTDPVGDSPHQRQTSEPHSSQDDSHVLARVPHVSDEAPSETYHQYGHSRSSHRGRRSQSQRPGIPAPVWVVVGMALVALIAAPFLMSKNSDEETALDAPNWEVEMPAPDAELAPAWSSEETNPQWQQPGSWPTEAVASDATTNAPSAWGTTGDWVGAPPNAPYANNTANPAAQAPAQPEADSPALGMPPNPSASSFAGSPPASDWGTTLPTATPPSPADYNAPGNMPQTAYPTTQNQPAAPWTDRTAASAMPSASPPTPTPNSWDQPQPASSLTTPQPKNVMPGYGNYSAARPDSYAGTSTNLPPSQSYYPGQTPTATAGRQQSPDYSPRYPIAGQPAPNPYPAPNYPQTAMSPKAPAAMTSPMPEGSYYPQQSVTPPNAYPRATGTPYPQTAPTASSSQPGYGTGASTQSSPRSVARLNGTIQDPAVRQAHDDRTGHSYY